MGDHGFYENIKLTIRFFNVKHMKNSELDLWWSSLPISQKERIARKAQSKTSPDGIVDDSKVYYPACTQWWESLDEAAKAKIYEHCVDRHGLSLTEWNNADPYGD